MLGGDRSFAGMSWFVGMFKSYPAVQPTAFSRGVAAPRLAALALFEAHAGDEEIAAGGHLAELRGDDEFLGSSRLLELGLKLDELLAAVPTTLDFLHPIADAAHALLFLTLKWGGGKRPSLCGRPGNVGNPAVFVKACA